MTKNRAAVLIAGVAALAALGLVYAYNPATASFFPPCIFHWLTGLDCPGCGAVRATHALLHGEVAVAFALNPLFVVAAPFVCVWLVVELFAKNPPRLRPKGILAIVVVLIVYGVLRNV